MTVIDAETAAMLRAVAGDLLPGEEKAGEVAVEAISALTHAVAGHRRTDRAGIGGGSLADASYRAATLTVAAPATGRAAVPVPLVLRRDLPIWSLSGRAAAPTWAAGRAARSIGPLYGSARSEDLDRRFSTSDAGHIPAWSDRGPVPRALGGFDHVVEVERGPGTGQRLDQCSATRSGSADWLVGWAHHRIWPDRGSDGRGTRDWRRGCFAIGNRHTQPEAGTAGRGGRTGIGGRRANGGRPAAGECHVHDLRHRRARVQPQGGEHLDVYGSAVQLKFDARAPATCRACSLSWSTRDRTRQHSSLPRSNPSFCSRRARRGSRWRVGAYRLPSPTSPRYGPRPVAARWLSI